MHLISMGFWSSILLLLCSLLLLVHPNFVSSSLQPSYSCLDHESSSLLQFKQSFVVNCTNFFSDDSYMYPKLESWDEGSRECCKWEGVECNHDTGHVIGLDLSYSCLYGTFPTNSTLFNLRHLEKLNLGFNHFNYSKIPHALVQLQKLTYLNLSWSFFSGQIPLEISKLSGLSVLDLSANIDPFTDLSLLSLGDPNLEGLVGNLTRLTKLNLGEVDISSTVPNVFVNLTSLKVISLRYCDLYGEFPSGILHLDKLEILDLTGNTNLVGSLPDFLPNSRLTKLNLEVTGFSGELPISIGSLTFLKELDLWHCFFTGRIPSTIGNLTLLSKLFLGVNHGFSGYTPFSITNLTHLEYLDISHLSFRHQDLMTWFPKLNKLKMLSLYGLELGNEVSFSFINFTQIRYLDLSRNSFKGTIPSWIRNQTQLTDLFLEENEFHGPIPEWISGLTNLGTLFLGYNKGLSGNLNTFFKLRKLTGLGLASVKLLFPHNVSCKSSLVKLNILDLSACNLTKFPEFLRDQNELKSLSLSRNNIQGSIPEWFMKVTESSLLLLDLSDNSLTGFEQPLLILPWNFLNVFNLRSNRLQGMLPIPSSSLLVYQVSNNSLSGVIPEMICNISSLKVLDLSDNKMNGSIPHCLGSQLARSLLVLNLRGNNFNGRIVQTFNESCRLKMINLSNNQLEGNLPRLLVNCQMLEVLDIGRNHINDTFPSWLGGLPKLQVLVLRHNNFRGVITGPRNGSAFPSLRIVDLSHNFYSGDLPCRYFQQWDLKKKMPENVTQMSSSSGNTVTVDFPLLDGSYVDDFIYNYSITITIKGNEILYPKIFNMFSVVDFSSNKFKGNISNSIGKLKGLQALNLSNNNLEGSIPSTLSYMNGLESLDLSQNMLSGRIPLELLDLTFLAVFNVSHNNLVGPIPQGKQFNTFDNSSYDGNLGLCGLPLFNKCTPVYKGGFMASSSTLINDEYEALLVDWIIRLLGFATGFLVSFILVKLFITDKYHQWFVETLGRKKNYKRRARKVLPIHRS